MDNDTLQRQSPPPLMSIVIPVYNEAENLGALHGELTSILRELNADYELIFVNDGSRDSTLQVLLSIQQNDPRAGVIDFSRNFGKECAISAGIEHAGGEVIVPIDADLQHPPEVIGKMLDRWRDGADIVFAMRRSREKESFLKRGTSKIFYALFGKVSGIPNHEKIGDFCLLDRSVAEVLKRLPERNRFMKGLFAWIGFKQDFVVYDLRDRNSGVTKWNYWKLWNFAIQGITSFSTVPLRVWTYVGFILSTASMLYAGKVVYMNLVYGIKEPGYPSLMVAVLFLGGIQLISLGVIGEYLGRTYMEVKGRPLYLVRRRYGVSSAPPAAHPEAASPLDDRPGRRSVREAGSRARAAAPAVGTDVR